MEKMAAEEEEEDAEEEEHAPVYMEMAPAAAAPATTPTLIKHAGPETDEKADEQPSTTTPQLQVCTAHTYPTSS
jgi:hypothetical protein